MRGSPQPRGFPSNDGGGGRGLNGGDLLRRAPRDRGRLDLACVAAVSDWAQDHPVFLAAAVEAVLLLGTYVVIERVVAERERERWNRAAQGSVFDLWFFTQTVVGTFADWERKAEPGDSLWRHFTRSVQTLRATVDKTEPRMQATPELARLWPRFNQLSVGFHFLRRPR